MPGMTSRTEPGPVSRFREEDGFGLIEVMVSAVMVIILALATLSLLDRSNQAAASSRSRATASNLAHAALNTMRAMTFTSLRNYRSTTATTTEGAIKYTVTSRADWTTDANAPLNCSSTGSATPYLKVTSTVTWPNMGGVQPVTASSFMSPRSSDLENGAGSLVVTIHNAAGLGVPGVTVTAQGESIVTDNAGCVIFQFLAAGATTVAWVKPNYVTPAGDAIGRQDVSIVSGKIATITPSYDVPASVGMAFKQDTTGTTSSWFSGQITTGGTFYKTVASTDTAWLTGRRGSFTQAGLYPTTAGYGVYAGDCTGNDPTVYVSNFPTTHPLAFVKPPPGGSVTGTAYLERTTITVTGPARSTVRLVVTPYDTTTYRQMASCNTGFAVTGTVPGSSGTGTLTMTQDMPYGVWSVCADNNTTGNNARMSTSTLTPYGVIPTGTLISSAATPPDRGGTTQPAQSLTMKTTRSGPCPT
jgi:Tfp pilus assembly protein PilV